MNPLRVATVLRKRWQRWTSDRRWKTLRSLGMKIGERVLLPDSTWIDASHCFLISIGDDCGFGPECLILAHDAQMDEFLDAARVGTVNIRESSHIGARCIILPGVEIGPRTIVGAGSVITRSLPPETVCGGNPAKMICSLDEYLTKHRERIAARPTFEYREYDIRSITPERKARLIAAAMQQDVYIVGGRTAELQGLGGTHRVR